MASRVILLGMGGLSLDLLDPLIHHGWLPNLEYLMGRGVVGALSSELPPFAPAEWATLLTGENPGVTGFVEGWRKAPGSYFPEDANLKALARRSPKSLLARSAPETVLVGVPLPAVSGPRPPEDGIQVLHWQAERFTVRSLPLPLPMAEGSSGGKGEEIPSFFLEGAIRRMIALSVSIGRMVKTPGARVVAIHFSGLDRVLSRFHSDIIGTLMGQSSRGLEGLLRQFFRVFDDAVGTVLDLSRKPGHLVVLASAHGFGPLSRVINLNAFLASRGDLALRVNSGRDTLLREVAAPMLRSMKIERKRIKQFINRPALKEVVDRASALFSSEIGLFDWNRTRAFALSRTGISLNVRGVESVGKVNPGPEERALGEEIRRSLTSLVDPATGRTPIKDVCWRHELFEGPGLSELPHLIVRSWESDYALEDWRKVAPSGEVFSDPIHRTGSPKAPGFYCFSGQSLPDRFKNPRPLDLSDIANAIVVALDEELVF